MHLSFLLLCSTVYTFIYSSSLKISPIIKEPRYEKTGLRGFRPGRHTPGCAATEDS